MTSTNSGRLRPPFLLPLNLAGLFRSKPYSGLPLAVSALTSAAEGVQLTCGNALGKPRLSDQEAGLFFRPGTKPQIAG
jgi:hypothetical protein